MAEPWKRIEGKVVMVTGASDGLDRELCLDLARSGCLVVAVARRAELLRSLCDAINCSALPPQPASGGSRAAYVQLDVAADESSIEPRVRAAWDAFGRVDVLVNNAGIRGGSYSSIEWSEEEWNQIISTNQTGLWMVSKHVCKLMIHGKVNGCVINVCSISSFRPSHGDIPYSSSKRAVNAITMAMALELGKYKIRVNSICLGIFKSNMTKGLLDKESLGKVVMKTAPLRTLGQSNPAFTSLVRYLIHDSSEYVSGNLFVVDAGINLSGIPIYSSL